MTQLQWTSYKLTMEVERLYGGIPKNPTVIGSWLESRGIINPALVQETIESVEVAEDKFWNGFKQNGAGLYVEARQVKAMLKDAANVVKTMVEVKNLKNKLADRLVVTPEHLSLRKAEPDGVLERAIHVETARGPRDALKRVDYVDNVKVSCTIRVLDDKVITENILRGCLEYAAEFGLGADRSQGGGRFTWTLTS